MPIRSPLLAGALSPITRRLVYPARATRISASGTDLHLSVDGADLRGWVVNPGRSRALVYFGGNGEALDRLRAELSGAKSGVRFVGHTTYLVAYRGYGASSGRPSEASLTSDALALHDHVARLHAGHPVDLLGRSLGSAVAVQVAVRRPVERLALVTPFDSITAVAADLFPRLPVPRLLSERWDSAGVAGRLSADVLVIRAGRDEVVRPARTTALLTALPGAAVVVEMPRADHRDVSEDPGYWPAIDSFLRRP